MKITSTKEIINKIENIRCQMIFDDDTKGAKIADSILDSIKSVENISFSVEKKYVILMKFAHNVTTTIKMDVLDSDYIENYGMAWEKVMGNKFIGFEVTFEE